jgi:hypothetical protein
MICCSGVLPLFSMLLHPHYNYVLLCFIAAIPCPTLSGPTPSPARAHRDGDMVQMTLFGKRALQEPPPPAKHRLSRKAAAIDVDNDDEPSGGTAPPAAASDAQSSDDGKAPPAAEEQARSSDEGKAPPAAEEQARSSDDGKAPPAADEQAPPPADKSMTPLDFDAHEHPAKQVGPALERLELPASGIDSSDMKMNSAAKMDIPSRVIPFHRGCH